MVNFTEIMNDIRSGVQMKEIKYENGEIVITHRYTDTPTYNFTAKNGLKIMIHRRGKKNNISGILDFLSKQNEGKTVELDLDFDESSEYNEASETIMNGIVKKKLKVVGLKLSYSSGKVYKVRFNALRLLCNQESLIFLDLELVDCEFPDIKISELTLDLPNLQ